MRIQNPVMNAMQGVGYDALVGRFSVAFCHWQRKLIAAASAGLVVAAPALADGAFQVSSLSASSVEYAAANGAPRDIAPYVRHMASLINEYRRRNGLGTLELVPDLNMIASEHSSRMATVHRMSHDGFRDRFDRTRARICVENVGADSPHAEALLDGWRASPGHHRNLLEPKVTRMGIAKSQSFVTFFACS